MEKVVLITSREIKSLMQDFVEITTLNSSYYEQFFGNYDEGIWKCVCGKLNVDDVTSLVKKINENFSATASQDLSLVKEELNKQSNKHKTLKEILCDSRVSIKDRNNPCYISGVYRLEVKITVGQNENGYFIYLAEEYPKECIADDDKSKFSIARQTYMNVLIESIVSDKKEKVEEIEWTILAHDNDFGKEGKNIKIERALDVGCIAESCSFLKTLCEGLDRKENPNRFFLFQHADGDRFYKELMKKSWHTLYGFLRGGSNEGNAITVQFKSDEDTYAEVLESSKITIEKKES